MVWRSSEGARAGDLSHGERVVSCDELGEVVDSVGIGEAGVVPVSMLSGGYRGRARVGRDR